jgi:hypothetical protein
MGPADEFVLPKLSDSFDCGKFWLEKTRISLVLV